MANTDYEKTRKTAFIVFCVVTCVIILNICGCGGAGGYTNQSLFRDNVESVCVDMFDNQTFYRGVEYKLTDALAKRIEAGTPYKIITSKDLADSVISGQITSIGESVLTAERETGRPLEKEVLITAVVNWKNLKTGELLIDNIYVSAPMSYSEWQGQGFEYASAAATNKLAKKIVEIMEKPW